MRVILIIFFLLASITGISQEYVVPILDLTTNARLNGFGGVGVVSSSFYNNSGIYQNPALISKHSKHAGIDFSYMPWLKNEIDDLNLYELSGYNAIDSSNAMAFNFSYFAMGEVLYLNDYGQVIGKDNPYEMFFNLSYNHSFNKNISAGVSIKYFNSNIVPDFYKNAKDVNSIALDIGMNYDKRYNLNNSSFLNSSAGAAITNLGAKVSYVDDYKEFIPTKLSLGLFINPDINIYDHFRLNIELAYQAEKFLIPTSPNRDIDGNIVDGYDNDISAFKALYQSFYDAPGGFVEEINEIKHKFGSEFRFNYQDYAYVAFRHGRQMEHETKGNRNYQTFGYGIGAFGFTIDYMRIKAENNSPLDETWAVSLGIITNLNKGFFKF